MGIEQEAKALLRLFQQLLRGYCVTEITIVPGDIYIGRHKSLKFIILEELRQDQSVLSLCSI